MSRCKLWLREIMFRGNSRKTEEYGIWAHPTTAKDEGNGTDRVFQQLVW